MALNRSLIASHLHLFFLRFPSSLKRSITIINDQKQSSIFSPDLSALNRFGANSVKLFLLFYLSSC